MTPSRKYRRGHRGHFTDAQSRLRGSGIARVRDQIGRVVIQPPDRTETIVAPSIMAIRKE